MPAIFCASDVQLTPYCQPHLLRGHVCTAIKAKNQIAWSPTLPCTSGKPAAFLEGEISCKSSFNSEKFLVQAVWMQAAWDGSGDTHDLTFEQCGCQCDIIFCKGHGHAGALLLTGVLLTSNISKSKIWVHSCLKLTFIFFSLCTAFSLSLPFHQFWTPKPQNQAQT